MSSDDRAAMQLPEEVWRAVEALHGRTWPPQSEADADRFIAAANGESLLPLLYEQESLPEAVASALPRHRALLRFYEQRASTLVSAARRVSDWLAEYPFLIFKGADYAMRLYPRPSLRPMRDLDFLTPLERIDAVAAKLLESGFELVGEAAAARKVASYHERTFVGHGFAVDLHHSFVQRARHRIDYGEIWRERETFAIDGVPSSRLSPAHAIVIQALMMAKEEFTVPLIRYVDFHRLLVLHEARLEEAVDAARRWRTVRALYGSLRLTARLFAATDLDAPMKKLLPGSTRSFLDRHVLPDLRSRAPKATRSRQLWAKFHLIDSYPRRFLFAAYHAWAVAAGRLLK